MFFGLPPLEEGGRREEEEEGRRKREEGEGTHEVVLRGC
jgi:hypothetical protein